MWKYSQATGTAIDPAGKQYRGNYAGRGEGKNNPILQDVHKGCRWDGQIWVPVDGLTANDWGPLCEGNYTIQPPVDSPTHGPFVLWLVPGEWNEMFGRSGFGWHGDSREHPGLASEGCICSPRTLRELVWASADRYLQVVA